MNVNDLICRGDLLVRSSIIKSNDVTSSYGLVLSEIDVDYLIDIKNKVLYDLGMVCVFEDVIEKIIYAFYDSCYIDKDCYVDMLGQLIEVFYFYQSNLYNRISDDEIISYIRDMFDRKCHGEVSFLYGECFLLIKNMLDEGKWYYE